MAEYRSEQPRQRDKTFMESAKLAMKRFYYRQLDPSIITRKVSRWYNSDQFDGKQDGAYHMTQEYIRKRFDLEFERTNDKAFIDPNLQTAVYYFVSIKVPAFQRTRTAFKRSVTNRETLKTTVEEFVRGVSSGRFECECIKTNDGFEQLMLRDGGKWHVLETTNAHVQVKKESDSIHFTEIMKKLFG